VDLLLVWLILTIWVTNLLRDVVLLVQDIVSNTSQVGVLQIGIQVDLDDTVADGILKFLLGRSGSTVEDQEDWLVLLRLGLILDILLVLGEELWVELDVSWLVHTVDVTETSGNREVWGDWGELVVNGKDIFWLSIKGVVVDILVVDTILLTTSDTNFLRIC
jgi:hypothetical protein